MLRGVSTMKNPLDRPRPAPSQGRLTIRCIKVCELEDFARTSLATLEPGEVVPTSMARAAAQTKNPCADSSDVGLLTAHLDDRCIGYLTLVPGLLRMRGAVAKVYRLSACYVPPHLRSTGAGGMLLLRALGLRRDVMVTGFSDDVRRLYEALRFKPLGPLRYLIAEFKNANLIGMLLRGFRKLSRTLGLAHTKLLDHAIDASDRTFKTVIYALLTRALGRIRRGVIVQRVDQIRDDAFEKVLDTSAPVRFARTSAEINWMLRERWVVTDPQRATPGYFFSDFDPLFDYVALELYGATDRDYKGFVVFRQDGACERRNLTLFDYHLKDQADIQLLFPIALEVGRGFLADVIAAPPHAEVSVQMCRLLALFVRRAERPYFCFPSGRDSLLARAAEHVELSLADGDLAFA